MRILFVVMMLLAFPALADQQEDQAKLDALAAQMQQQQQQQVATHAAGVAALNAQARAKATK